MVIRLGRFGSTAGGILPGHRAATRQSAARVFKFVHMATEAGDLKIVSEMLKAHYQQVNYKDAQCQTALRLAARLRRAEILPLLLGHNCSPGLARPDAATLRGPGEPSSGDPSAGGCRC